MLILKQNAANSVPTPAAGKGTIFLSDSDVLSVKNSSGNVESFPTVGGSNTQVMFNNDGALAGNSNFIFDKDSSVLTITGNVAATRVLTDNLLYANGAAWDLQEPAGANTQIQYNNNGDFGATSNFTFDTDTNTLTVIGAISATTLAGSLTTAAQTNITSVGTLTGLVVNGNASATDLSASTLNITGNAVAGNISTGGVLSGDTLSITNDAVINGNLAVNGNLTYINVDDLSVEDPLIQLGTGPNGQPLTTNDGKDRGTVLNYYSGGALQAFMGWDNSNAEFSFGSDVTVNSDVITFNTLGNVRAEMFLGNGASLSSITGANVTGEVANANFATYSGTANIANVAYSVDGANVVGEVAYAATANAVDGSNVSGEVSFAATANAVAGSNVSGEVSFAATANAVAGSNVSGEVSFAATANAVAGANVSGTVANATYADSAGTADTVTTNAQPNITSVGTLSSLLVANGSFGDFDGKIVSAYGTTGQGSPDWIGVVGEAIGNSANDANTGIGVLGVGSTTGNTRGTGVKGIAVVANSADSGAAVGVRGVSAETHSGGYNIGVLGSAGGSGVQNYALYVQQGNIGSIEADVQWDLNDNSATALTFGSSGKSNIFLVETTDNAEGIATSGYLNVTGNATVGGIKTDNYYYANGAPLDMQQPAGSNTQVQYNDDSDFGASPNFTFDSSTNILAVTNVSATSLTGTLTTADQPNVTSLGTLTSLDVTGNVGAGNVSATDVSGTTLGGTLTTAAQPNVTSVGTLTSLDVTGNVSAGNVSATAGDFTSVSGNGSALTALTGANVTGEVSFAATANAVAGANVSGEVAFADTANSVAGANVSGEVSFAATANAVAGANVSGEVGFAAVANSVAGANVSGTVSSATTAGTVTTAAQPNITSVGTLTGLGVNGDITATNITANTGVFTGDAGGLSNVVGANVTGTVSSATTAGTVTTAAQPNITSVGTLTSLSVTGNVSAGNVSATAGDFSTVSGNGSALSAITGANVTGAVAYATTANSVAGANVSGTVSSATTAGTVTTAAQPNITSVGTLTGLGVNGNITATNITANTGVFTGDAGGLSNVVGANVTGEVSFAATANAVAGANVSGTVSSATTAGTVTTAAQPNITSVGTLTSLSVTGNASAGNVSGTGGVFTYVSGDGANLTSITGQNVTGEVDFAQVANSVAGGNVSGQVANALVAGTVYTAAQPNITSVGTLSSVTVSGNATVQGNVVTDKVLGRTNANLSITAFSGNNSILLAPTGTGVVDVGAKRVVNGADPTSAKDLATKEYVDTVASASLHYHAPCRVESPVNLNASYNNGSSGVGATLTNAGANAALVIDGVSVNVADRVLVYQQTDQTQNGVYVVTTVGDGSTQWVLTRASDADTYSPSDPDSFGQGDAFFIQEGATGAGELYVMNTEGTITFGTTNITFVQISSSQIYSAGTGLDLTGVTFSLADTAVSPAAYGDSGNVSTFTVDQQGRLTAAGEVAIQAPASGITGSTLSSNVTTSSLTSVGTLGSLSVTGNVSAGNVSATAGTFTSVSGNGSALTALNASNISSGTLPSARLSGTYTITVSGSATTAGTVTTAAQPNITSVGTLTSLSVTGNASAGNVSATAGTFTSVSGNGSALTALNGSNITSGTIAAARVATLNQNTTGYAATVSSAAQPNITSVGTLTGLTIAANGDITMSGTGSNINGVYLVSANYFDGDGSNLSSITGGNVTGTVANATYATSAGSATSATSATTAGTVTTAAQPNITSVGTLTSLSVSGNANAGNVGATNFVGSGASLTSLNGSNITSGTIAAARVATLNQNTTGYAATVSGAAQANITSVGTLTGLTIAANGDITMSGTGSQITGVALVSSTLFAGSGANLTNLNGSNISSGTIAAARIATLNQNTTGYAATVSSAAQPNITSVGTLTSLSVTGNANVGNIGATNFVGSGASLTSLNGSQITSGTIAAARVATLNQNTTGYAATVSSAAQPNITSVGTLSSLAISGTNTLTVRTISTGANTTSGTITGNWSLSTGSKLNATYADLAEKYTADQQYEPGTVVVFGGDAELSTTGAKGSHTVAGIVTTNPAQVYNADLVAPDGQFVVELALIGRVPCKVIGPIAKGDLIVTSDVAGFGCAADPETVKPGSVIGKAIQSYNGDSPDGMVEVLVGKN